MVAWLESLLRRLARAAGHWTMRWRAAAYDPQRRRVSAGVVSLTAVSVLGAGCARPEEEPTARGRVRELPPAPERSPEQTEAVEEQTEALEDLVEGRTRASRAPVLGELRPLPSPTDADDFERAWFAEAESLFAVNLILTQALRAAGYRWFWDWVPGLPRKNYWSYFRVSGGFALLTHTERLVPTNEAQAAPPLYVPRFGYSPPDAPTDLSQAIGNLLVAPLGYYRQIVLLVTDRPWREFVDAGLPAPERELPPGAPELPREEYEAMEFGPEHAVTALVYEFEKRDESQGDVPPAAHGLWSARQHLGAVRTALTQRL
jgi:hypothetical protein